ncbi:transposase [Actinoplanes sp. NEAU-A12]|uniref:Transposase n=1 Tax=Actinoplanes sandaracinus TaxID=3045177 RepID=A0ABT6X1Y2_9ACTN|nr:transposase [Actinoplanes sandaracinus]MDI6105993.1 transposase [Actinoplanes sandaracinus]
MRASEVIWVGIDAGKTSHDAAAVDADGRRLWSVKVGSGQGQLERLVARAAKTAPDVRWAVDLVSPVASLLITVLLTKGQHVIYVPGRMPLSIKPRALLSLRSPQCVVILIDSLRVVRDEFDADLSLDPPTRFLWIVG